MAHVEIQRFDGLLHLRLNRPEQQNQFTQEMLSHIGRALRDADDDPHVRAILFTGEGADFCTGGDVADILPAWKQGINPIAPGDINPMGLSARRLTKPLITIVQGHCTNGGFELALASDICIAADNARFACEEMRFATFPFAGGVLRFVRAAGKSNALRYVFTAEEFGAQEAFRMNLVATVKPLAEVQTYGLEFAKRISRCAPLAMQAVLKQMHVWFDEGDAAALKTAIAEEVKLLNSKDCAEAMHAMMEKRTPVFTAE